MKSPHVLAMVVAAASLCAPTVFAQTHTFQGWSLGLNVESTNTTTSPTSTASQSASSTSANMQAQYTWAIGKSFLLGAGLTLGMGDNKAGTFTAGTQEGTVRSRLSFDVVPGYAISPTWLVYGKVSSVGATYELNTVGQPTYSTTLSGVGYGAGVRAMVSKSAYVQVEYDTLKYNRISNAALLDVSVDASTVTVGLGYHF